MAVSIPIIARMPTMDTSTAPRPAGVSGIAVRSDAASATKMIVGRFRSTPSAIVTSKNRPKNHETTVRIDTFTKVLVFENELYTLPCRFSNIMANLFGIIHIIWPLKIFIKTSPNITKPSRIYPISRDCVICSGILSLKRIAPLTLNNISKTVIEYTLNYDGAN